MNKKILIIATFTLFADQIFKSVMSAFMKLNQSIEIIKNFFEIKYINNYGAAWGILEHQNILLIVVATIGLIIVYRYMYLFKKNTRNNIAFGLLIGGIVGNLIDRWIFGYVRDFFSFCIFNYDFPIFNFADIAVVFGVILLIIAILKGEDRIDKISSK